ncbi:IS3 family transposase [Veillonella tobetsuensis]|uniref:IS3 family transposase n=1 Tax=Veillonella tobetsuensis TaxID=1110546 RepID=A0A2S7ZN93_9FIRM|nr:IS3 family transposase [Veillonella tobetsuensis]PQL24136.1 IS3 family transposase [Veillonella tobetsuensis]PQL24654.1 IS3 family transposase [Veillonella tobetsuensis]PQL25627.1 IS3 family transposase [Veillonella tobetsuensis]PQL26033.1 IS3 family transposase [Veillonella tobetsuensis]
MAKYSLIFKLKVVTAYLNGEGGYEYLTKKYGLKTTSQVRRWISAFKEFGKDGLCRKRNNTRYTSEFKLAMVESYLTSELSYRQIALQYGLNNPSLIARWKSDFMKYGTNAFVERPKGRIPTMSRTDEKAKITTHTKSRNQKKKKELTPEQARILELEKQLRYAQIENAYLKELRRLRLEDARKMKEQQESLAVSEEKFKLTEILAALRFPKATYMYWQQRFDRVDPDLQIRIAIEDIRKNHPNYGYRRLLPLLRSRGIVINKKRLQRIMQKFNLQVIAFSRKSRKYNSYKGVKGRIAPNRIKRRFYCSQPHQKITTDTTEFKYYELNANGALKVGKLYLDPFMDLYNLEIISFSISPTPSAESILSAQQQAIEKTADAKYRRTFHSDRGWGYQMKAYQHNLKVHNIFQSMSRRGNCLDNSPMENFFAILKQEMYYDNTFHSYDELKMAIENYIMYYNTKRIKEKLNWLSPVDYRLAITAA